MDMQLIPATSEDVAELVVFRQAVSDHLAQQYGPGYWAAGSPSEKALLFQMRQRPHFIARHQGQIVATLALGPRKPWAIDVSYFTPVKRALYLTSMEVSPELQRQGLGRACLHQATEIAKGWPADAIRLDAYDAPAGAGSFYAKCGYREVGRTAYHNAPLIYYEIVIE